MKKSLFAILFTFTLLCGAAHAAYLRTGTYELLGSNSENGDINYRGYVTITSYGNNYNLIWLIGSQQVQSGTGILMNDVLSVCYADLTKDKIGVVSYKLTADGELWGKWAQIGDYTAGRELLTWVAY